MFLFRRRARAAQGAQSLLIAHERAVGVAEAVVRRAWAEELLRRSDHADFAVRAARQGREAAYGRLAAAQLDGDPRKISLAHAWLERALDAERTSALDRIRVRQTLSAELDLLARVARERSAPAQATELEQHESVITAEPREMERDVQVPQRERRVERWLARWRMWHSAGCEQP